MSQLGFQTDFLGLRNTYSANFTGKKKVIHQIGMSDRPYLQACLSFIVPNRFHLMRQRHSLGDVSVSTSWAHKRESHDHQPRLLLAQWSDIKGATHWSFTNVCWKDTKNFSSM